MNLYPRPQHYNTVEHSGRRPRGNEQSWVGYGSVLEREALICESHVMLRKFRMLGVYLIWEAKTMKVEPG
jgi:hypothetical protein